MHVGVCSQKNVIECRLCGPDRARASLVSGKPRNRNSASQEQEGLEQTMVQRVLVRHGTLVNTGKMKKTEMRRKYLPTSQYFALIEMLCEWKAGKKARKTERGNRKQQRNSQDLPPERKQKESTENFQSFIEKKLLQREFEQHAVISTLVIQLL